MVGLSGDCTLCFMLILITDEDGNGTYENQIALITDTSSTINCGESKLGTYDFGPSPSTVGNGLPASLPYKVQFFATPKKTDALF